MKVLIIEDEKPASGRLIRLLGEIDRNIEVIGVLSSVEQASNWFVSNPHPDLVFMDIQLEDGLCFEIFESCEVNIPVIFTTAYDEYTLRAFRVNSIDYLLKPIDGEGLIKALVKYQALHRDREEYEAIRKKVVQLSGAPRERFLIRIGEHFRPVQTREILCFYILEKNNFLFTASGKSYPLDYPLDRIEQMVDPRRFFRINRNFIVSYSAISDIIAYSSSRLKLILPGWTGEDEILVSRERVAAFKEWMDR
jgi:two-component system response regulator LytT